MIAIIVTAYAFTIFKSMHAPEMAHIATEKYSTLKYLESAQHISWTTVDINAVVSGFIFWFHHDFKLQIVMIAISLLLLVSICLGAFWRSLRQGLSIATKIEFMLTFLGVSSLLLYLASPWFVLNLDYHMPFEPRYEIVLVFCAAVATICVILRIKTPDARPLVFGSVFGFCLALT